jgi:hypothetical protein
MPVDALIQGMKVEMNRLHTQLYSSVLRLEDLRIRAAKILKAIDESESYSDAHFESDFNKLRKEIRNLINKTIELYHFSVKATRRIKMAEDLTTSLNLSTGFMLETRKLKIEAEKLSEEASLARNFLRKLPLKIYWWEMDRFTEEFVNLSVLFLKLSKILHDYISMRVKREDLKRELNK